MNSPDKVLCRLINSDYFENIINDDLKLFSPRIKEHKSRCEYCIEHNQDNSDIEKIKDFLGKFEETVTDMIDFEKVMGMKNLNNIFSKSINQVKDELDKVVILKDKEKLEKLSDVSKILNIFC